MHQHPQQKAAKWQTLGRFRKGQRESVAPLVLLRNLCFVLEQQGLAAAARALLLGSPYALLKTNVEHFVNV